MMKTAYLTEQDREIIMAKVNYNVDAYLNEEKTMEIIELNWAKAKSKKLFDIFGGELIKKKQINITKSREQFIREFRDEEFPFINALTSFVYAHNSKQLPYDDRDFILSLTRPSALFNNRVPSSYTLELNGKKPVKFSEGQKLAKAIKQVCEAIGFDAEEHGFEKFRIRLSQMLNDKTIKGT